MKKEASLPVRLESDISHRLDLAAEKLGLTKSALIRILVRSFVDQMEANGGKIVFPLQWKTGDMSDNAVRLQRVAEARSEYITKKTRKKGNYSP